MLSKEYKLLWITCALPDKNGKTSGRPKFKGKHYYNSLSYPQLSNSSIDKVSKSLSERWHSCPRCGQELDRDYNSALLIQKIGLLSTQGEDITSHKTVVRVSLAEESRVVP